MSKQKYKKIICVITHKGSSDKVEAIKQTWLSKPMPSDYLLLFVYGNDYGVVPRLERNNLYLEAEESWANLPNKTFDLIHYCHDHFEFDYLFKIDDDNYFSWSFILNYPLKELDYAGYFHELDAQQIAGSRGYGVKYGTGVYTGRMPHSFVLGPVYVLSRKVVSLFVQKKRSDFEECGANGAGEDHMIGRFIENCIHEGVSIQQENWLHGSFLDRIFKQPFYFTALQAQQIKELHQPLWVLRLKLAYFLKNQIIPAWILNFGKAIRSILSGNQK